MYDSKNPLRQRTYGISGLVISLRQTKGGRKDDSKVYNLSDTHQISKETEGKHRSLNIPDST